MRMTFDEWFFSNKEKIIDLYNKETDPNYSCKLACAQGKVIQYRNKDSSDWWADCVVEPNWSDTCEYRVKPEPGQVVHRMTNRELAKWIAQGNGECVCDDISMTCWRYVCSEADMPVKDGVQVRVWDETEFSEPLVEE